MAEHPHDRPAGDPPSGRATSTEVAASATAPSPGAAPPRERETAATGSRSRPLRRLRRPATAGLRTRLVGAIATIAALATTVVVAVLAVHIVFAVFEANGSNDIVIAFRDWADGLVWQFKDVFAPHDPKVAVLVNYGLAAVVYLVAGRIVVGLIRRLG
ncbi:hypothetical protein [Actinomadura sp. HBU206391]|uniref:hypothetical protein n=1 Tax=Actinomadura sp. HBU206391 TaxID=2731692 RepID=UPI00164F13E5|nr:hypothetical protein [Actinomadura sp. HBU206391]MBC6460297.1 hypothetical protein [Actinomadura sp. HBU206391]